MSERGDSGLRSIVSMQGARCVPRILDFGAEAQKERWLAPMARGEAIGCFRLPSRAAARVGIPRPVSPRT